MDIIREAIVEILAKHAPQTVRQVFYAQVVLGVIEKTEAEYKQTVVRLLIRCAGTAMSIGTTSPT
jgi:hypothetical protein